MAKKGLFGGYGSRQEQLDAQESAASGTAIDHTVRHHTDNFAHKHAKMLAPEKLSRAIGKVLGEKDYDPNK